MAVQLNAAMGLEVEVALYEEPFVTVKGSDIRGGGGGMNAGAVAGIAVAIAAVCGCAVAALYSFHKRRQGYKWVRFAELGEMNKGAAPHEPVAVMPKIPNTV